MLQSHSIIVLAASRIIFAIARDGALPLSSWVSRTTSSGSPRNAVTLVYLISAALLCTVLPSTAAFVSLISGGALPLIANYAIIALLRLVLTPNEFKHSRYSLGKFAKPLYVATLLYNGFMFAVFSSPYVFPVTAQSLNFGPVIFGGVTLFGLMSWWFIPQGKWLRKEQIEHTFEGAS
ncbi:hypothetical protein FS749_010788 [Ceratobasidium sp. UAMH 11750]|nr:hypothetical protein FS749_010788 [Ceratobasidium sp. UAMH 11750]